LSITCAEAASANPPIAAIQTFMGLFLFLNASDQQSLT